jgi:hypothetical protein
MSGKGNADSLRLAVKFFASGNAPVELRSYVPVFHAWIQRQAISGHLLIDVHDYSHIHRGPGILLVAHEGNFSLDTGDGRLGLLYNRKADVPGGLDRALAAAARAALEACLLLETETGLRFRTDEALIVANDRLAAPNDAGTADRLRPPLQTGLRRLWPTGAVTLEAAASNAKERFALRVRTPQGETLQGLLARA